MTSEPFGSWVTGGWHTYSEQSDVIPPPSATDVTVARVAPTLGCDPSR